MIIGLGIFIIALTVVSAMGILPSLRIVPDNTHFDFTRFRRISFPISAVLVVLCLPTSVQARRVGKILAGFKRPPGLKTSSIDAGTQNWNL